MILKEYVLILSSRDRKMTIVTPLYLPAERQLKIKIQKFTKFAGITEKDNYSWNIHKIII